LLLRAFSFCAGAEAETLSEIAGMLRDLLIISQSGIVLFKKEFIKLVHQVRPHRQHDEAEGIGRDGQLVLSATPCCFMPCLFHGLLKPPLCLT
jgi:hypothetical protein